MIDIEKEKNFLKELAELSNKYKIAVGGCGCCSSPYLYEVAFEGQYFNSDMLTFELPTENLDPPSV